MDRLERLVNLVAALLDTPRPMTRAEIRERIDGYASDPEAFRRNFERDKELLRQMGFPLVTVADPANPEELGYRIPRELYELPDPGLDDSELAALRLAASAVQIEGDGTGDAVVMALRKLGGAAGDAPGGRPAGPDDPEAALAALPAVAAAAEAFAAVAERRRVSFSYHGEDRLVDPWRLSFHRGHWYLSGYDHGRGGERLFRLDRLEGPVAPAGAAGAFERPDWAQTAPPPAWRLGDAEEQLARLLVDAEQARWARQALGEAAVREVRPDGSVVFEVAVTSPESFRSFVIGYLDHAEILGPPALRQEMIAWLERLAGAPS